MLNAEKDIKQFNQLRKQLAPVLNNSHRQLFERIEERLGNKNETIQPASKILTHDERVRKHLKF